MKENERKIGKVEKVIRLLDYLKEYTDENNPASIPQIERYFRSKGYTNFIGTKNTRQKMIKEMAIAMNTDIDGNLLPKENWRVVYNDFIRENTPGAEPLKEHHIVNLYYKKEFQDAEEKCFWKKESKKYYRGLSLFTPIQFLCMGKVGHVINLLITMLPSVLQRQLDDARNVFLELTILKT